MVAATWARSEPEMMRRIGRATRRSLAWIQAHSPEDISHSMPQEYKGDDASLYLSAVRDIRPTFSPDGIMPADGPANVQRFLAVSDQRVQTASIDLSATYTNQFIESR
jgi:NitT/TauT family transport system substrate-binding protein